MGIFCHLVKSDLRILEECFQQENERSSCRRAIGSLIKEKYGRPMEACKHLNWLRLALPSAGDCWQDGERLRSPNDLQGMDTFRVNTKENKISFFTPLRSADQLHWPPTPSCQGTLLADYKNRTECRVMWLWGLKVATTFVSSYEGGLD